MPEDPTQHGTTSRETGSEAIKESWGLADEANAAEPPGRPENAPVWIPIQAISLRPDILPRVIGEDQETIDHYVDVLDELPPIKVQKDTLVLIGGLNRVRAHEKAVRRIIKAEIVDVPDDQLWIEAYRDNMHHGLAMTAADRRQGIKRFCASFSSQTDAEIAKEVGVSEWTIQQYRSHLRKATTVEEIAGLPDQPAAPRGPGQKEREFVAQKGLSPVPKPGANGGAPKRAPNLGDLFQVVLEQSPRDMADNTPDERLKEAQAQARAAAKWFSEYAEALNDRLAEMGAKTTKGKREPVGATAE